MSTGLAITHKKDRKFGRWLVAFCVVALICTGIYYGYSWYTKGTPLPVPIAAAKGDPRIDESDVSPAAIQNYTVPADHPRYINIPALGIGNTRVYPVGVTKENLLDTPSNIHDAAWYKKSQTPGNGYGAVLIDAHNGGISKNGVFAKLSTLKEGDQVTVERGDGEKFTYAVVENETMSLEEVNKTGMKKMMQSVETGKEGLSLITCAGNWVPRLQQFDKRVMVRAVIVDNSGDSV